MIKNLILVFGLSLASWSASASQQMRLEVNRHADVYNVYVEKNIDASADIVRSILTDYEKLDRLNDSITSSKIIDTEREDVVRVVTRFESCVFFFCMDLQKVEDVIEDNNGRILVVMVPGSSNFRSGESSWEVLSTKEGSRVIHRASMEPNIWLPSWVGSAMVKDTLSRELEESFENLECLSRKDCQQQPVVSHEFEWDDDF